MRLQRVDGVGGSMRMVLAAGVLGLGGVAVAPFVGVAREVDAQAALPLARPGTPFHFEVIESHDSKYPGDTPAHSGKDGGLTVRPQVALGDPVYRTVADSQTLVGRITRVQWNRVSGSLEVEFDPEPLQRIAVGDEVWVDLNPALEAQPDGGR
ncbi:MAG: hypothetical protein WCR51_02245 [Planctomycetia bacterium]